MVRRKMIQAAMQSLLKTQPAVASVRSAMAAPMVQFDSVQAQPTKPNLNYISERVNNVFNIILAEIAHKNAHPPLGPGSIGPNASIYRDPYAFRDRILADLVSNSDINSNYNIHDLIEEEFGLEISDQEFQRFKSLGDIVKYVNERLEVRQAMFAFDGGHGNTNLSY